MQTFTRELSRNLSTGPAPSIAVSAIDGSITVRGEERGDVYLRVSARIRADSPEQADEMMRRIEDGIEAGEGYLKLQAQREHAGRGLLHGLRDLLSALERGVRVDYELVVPRDSRVELRALNGEATVQDIARDVNAETVNGAIRLTGIGGNASIRTVNGRIRVEGCEGDVSLNQKNGDVELRGVRGRCSLRMLNGSLQIIDAGNDVHARALNGEMSYRGAVRGDVSLNSAHGSIECYVPRDARFLLDAASHLGEVRSELSVSEKGASGGGRLPHVSLRSQTGSIALRALDAAVTAS